MSPRRPSRAEEPAAAGGRCFTVHNCARGRRVLRIRDQGRPRAKLNSCPHAGVNLDWTPRESGLRFGLRIKTWSSGFRVGSHYSEPELAGLAA